MRVAVGLFIHMVVIMVIIVVVAMDIIMVVAMVITTIVITVVISSSNHCRETNVAIADKSGLDEVHHVVSILVRGPALARLRLAALRRRAAQHLEPQDLGLGPETDDPGSNPGPSGSGKQWGSKRP